MAQAQFELELKTLLHVVARGYTRKREKPIGNGSNLKRHEKLCCADFLVRLQHMRLRLVYSLFQARIFSRT